MKNERKKWMASRGLGELFVEMGHGYSRMSPSTVWFVLVVFC